MRFFRFLAVLLLSVVVLGERESRATIIFGDPGDPGAYPFGFSFDITDDFKSAFGSTVSGQKVLLDLVFSGLKHVESPSDEGWSVLLVVNHDSVGGGNLILPDILDIGISNEFGQIIRSADFLFGASSSPPQSISDGSFSPTSNEFFHDVHFDINLPDYESDPNISQVFVSFPTDGSFIIGEWGVIPEPSTLTLAALALLGLLAHGRRRRRA